MPNTLTFKSNNEVPYFYGGFIDGEIKPGDKAAFEEVVKSGETRKIKYETVCGEGCVTINPNEYSENGLNAIFDIGNRFSGISQNEIEELAEKYNCKVYKSSKSIVVALQKTPSPTKVMWLGSIIELGAISISFALLDI